jgi:hypothetical protein
MFVFFLNTATTSNETVTNVINLLHSICVGDETTPPKNAGEMAQ